VGGHRHRVERILATAHLESDEGVERLQRTLERTGVFAVLKEHGVKQGDRVIIRGIELEYVE
jgi:Obg family GTPase CgtA-like protein